MLSIALFLFQGGQNKDKSPAPATGAGAGVGPGVGAAGAGDARNAAHQGVKRSSDDMAGGTNSGSGASKKQKQV